jgi:hypothetical protein
VNEDYKKWIKDNLDELRNHSYRVSVPNKSTCKPFNGMSTKRKYFSMFQVLEKYHNIADKNDVWLEFGVYKGNSVNQVLSPHAKPLNIPIYGFDTFTGIPIESGVWKKNQFDNDGNMPKVEKNINLIKGDIFETLPIFLKDEKIKNKNFKFIHIDTDIYESAKFILETLFKANKLNNSIIVFDELLHYNDFEHHEFKALYEMTQQYDDFKFEWVGIRNKVMDLETYLSGKTKIQKWGPKKFREEEFEQEVVIKTKVKEIFNEEN